MKITRLSFKPDLVLAIHERRKRVTRRLARMVPIDPPPGVEPDPVCHLGQAGDLLWVPERWRVAEAQCILQYPGRVKACRWTSRAWLTPRSMARWASRLWLSLVGARLEKLQEITDEEAVLEGFTPSKVIPPREQFMHKWDAIYQRNTRVADVAWKDNPLVWRVEFDPIEVDEARKRIKAAGLTI